MDKIIPSKYKKNIIEINGSPIYAWDKKTSLTFLSDMETKSFAILGGDVLRFNTEKSRYEYSYDSWHLERNGPNENFYDYCLRSQHKAIDYINNYPANTNTLFALIVSVELTAGL